MRLPQLLLLHCAASTIITLDDTAGPARPFHGIGGLSGGGATSVFLRAYPEPQRSELLDFLFKPNYGAALQILKVEIGAEGQSTDGAEASHMRDPWSPPDFERGYEFWLMKEAKARNPNITLYGLPWTWPAWIACPNGTLTPNCSGGPFTIIPQAVAYISSWVKGAKEVHGLDIDWLGVWNERSAGDNYVEALRGALDGGGFTGTRIITWDNWAWGAPNGSDAMGVHYPGIYPLPEKAVATGLPAWSSEDSSTYNNQFGAECWARVINQNYAVSNLTASIIWNLASAYMKGTKSVPSSSFPFFCISCFPPHPSLHFAHPTPRPASAAGTGAALSPRCSPGPLLTARRPLMALGPRAPLFGRPLTPPSSQCPCSGATLPWPPTPPPAARGCCRAAAPT